MPRRGRLNRSIIASRFHSTLQIAVGVGPGGWGGVPRRGVRDRFLYTSFAVRVPYSIFIFRYDFRPLSPLSSAGAHKRSGAHTGYSGAADHHTRRAHHYSNALWNSPTRPSRSLSDSRSSLHLPARVPGRVATGCHPAEKVLRTCACLRKHCIMAGGRTAPLHAARAYPREPCQGLPRLA